MSQSGSSALDRLRQPEYTGENRCLPCTVLNIAIALAVSALVAAGALSLAGSAVALGAAGLVFGVSVLAIALRGYLVPGTPELTKRYLPASVLRRFGKDPIAERTEDEFVDGAAVTGGTEEGSADDADGEDDSEDGYSEPDFETVEKIEYQREHSVDPETFLTEVGAIEPDPEAELDYAFTEAFAPEARERLPDDLDGVDPERLAPLFDVEPAEIEPLGRDYPAYKIGLRIRKWPTPAALALDLATFEALADWTDRWADVPMEQRLDVVEWLRGFYADCPVCGGPVVLGDSVVESCCTEVEVTTLSCGECGVHLREFDPGSVTTPEDLSTIVP